MGARNVREKFEKIYGSNFDHNFINISGNKKDKLVYLHESITSML